MRSLVGGRGVRHPNSVFRRVDRSYLRGARSAARERELARLRRTRRRRTVAIDGVAMAHAGTGRARPTPSLLGILARAAVLTVVAWVLVTYVLPALLDLYAAPYR